MIITNFSCGKKISLLLSPLSRAPLTIKIADCKHTFLSAEHFMAKIIACKQALKWGIGPKIALSSLIFLFPYGSLWEPVQATKLIDPEVSNFCSPTLMISCQCLQKRVWRLTCVFCCTAFHLFEVISNSNYKNKNKKIPLLVSPLSKGPFTITIENTYFFSLVIVS